MQCVRGEAVGNNFFKEFAKAFEEGDGLVCFGGSVVQFMGFGDDDHFGSGPGVVSEFKSMAEEGEEV